MELLKRYSKPEYQGRRLHRIVDLVAKSAKTQVTGSPPLPQVQLVDRLLSAQTIAELVQAYRDGATTPELRQRYGLNQGSVLKVLRKHDVTMRARGLSKSKSDIPIAAELYRSGDTLAQIGRQFGSAPNTLRKVLIEVGVTIRPRGISRQTFQRWG